MGMSMRDIARDLNTNAMEISRRFATIKKEVTKMNNVKITEISYPTDAELERMYAEFLKSGSFPEFFGDDPFYSIILSKNNLLT